MIRFPLEGATGMQTTKEDDVPPVSHQTIKLSRGKHSSPEHGACVMELASMLAGEGFSDHPRSVSRPIASFLRGYNDLLDDRRRQDLYAYAARAVGTASSRAVEDARAAELLAWGDALWERRARGSLLARLRRRRVRNERSSEAEPAGTYAVHAIGRVGAESHAAALRLIDELIEMGAAPYDRVRDADRALLLPS
jgi:hypothetical protein